MSIPDTFRLLLPMMCFACSDPAASASAPTDLSSTVADTGPDAGADVQAATEVTAANATDATATDATATADTAPAKPVPQWVLRKPLPQPLWGALVVAGGQAGVFHGFGGNAYPSGGVSGLTWKYDTEADAWSSQQPPGSPPLRYCHCLVAMPERGELLLVGGRNADGGLPAGAWTFGFAAQSWQAVDGPVPQGTIGCHAGWLPKLQGGRALVFGGQGLGVGFEQKTWLYDPGKRTFSEQATAHLPPSRRDGATVSDVAVGRVLIFGGQTAALPNAAHTNDLWQFDGSDWQAVATTGPMPSARRYAGSAFDSVRRRWLLFSGTNEKQDFEDLTLFDAASHTFTDLGMQGAPDARSFAALFYDPLTDAYYLFGGALTVGVKGQDDGYRLTL